MTRILVTGASGFIGSNLTRNLVNTNDQINILIRNQSNLWRLNDIISRCNVHFVDITKIDEVRTIISEIKPEIVYHCAATAHEGLSVFSPYEITKNNYLASISIFTAAVNEKVKRIIFCSSMARYGDQKTPFTEKMKAHPVDPYAISKVAAEEVLANLCELNGI